MQTIGVVSFLGNVRNIKIQIIQKTLTTFQNLYGGGYRYFVKVISFRNASQKRKTKTFL